MFPLTQDVMIGSRKGRESREVCAFCFDHFSPRQHSYAENCSIMMKIGTHIVEVID